VVTAAQVPSRTAAATPAQRRLVQNLLLESELLTIAQSFAGAGLELIVLKGVPLTRRLYGGLEQRFSVDNDLLVRKQHAARAVALLEDIGYVSHPGRTLLGDLSSTFQHPMRRQTAGDVTLRAELHWHAFPPHLFDVPEDDLWQRTEPFVVRGQTLWVFDEVMTLLHLASHHVQHRCVEAKVLRDVGAAWQRFHCRVDKRELATLAARYGLAAALEFGIAGARRAGLCSAESALDSSRARLLGALMPTASEGAIPSYWAILGSLLLASPSRISHAFAYELFPPLPVMARVYETEPTPWLVARYPLRLLRPLTALLGWRR
jgi:hypothetical protein